MVKHRLCIWVFNTLSGRIACLPGNLQTMGSSLTGDGLYICTIGAQEVQPTNSNGYILWLVPLYNGCSGGAANE